MPTMKNGISAATSPERRRQAVQGLALLAAIVMLMWLIEGINALDGGGLDTGGGIYPRNFDHLWAIFTSPFLHENFYPHLVDNTIPFAFMGVIIALRGAARLALVTLIVIVVGGLGTWLIAPAGTDTIGASGVVFGYATYLFARGLFDRSALEILTGVVVGVIWGGALVSSIVPHTGVSWQAHASGAVGGVIAAWLLAGRHQRAGDGPRSPGGGAPPVEPGHRHLHESMDRANRFAIR
jgi:membrane associated rhomboid family serine protease